MTALTKIIIGFVILLIVLFVFQDSIILGLVMMPFSNLQLNGLVFAPDYDPETTDGSDILECLHGGECPKGVSYVDDPEIVDNTYADSDGDFIRDGRDDCPFVAGVDFQQIDGVSVRGCPLPILNDLPILNEDGTVNNDPNNIANIPNQTLEEFLGISTLTVPEGCDPCTTFNPTFTFSQENLKYNQISDYPPTPDSNLNLNSMVNNAIVIFGLIVVLVIGIIVILVRKRL